MKITISDKKSKLIAKPVFADKIKRFSAGHIERDKGTYYFGLGKDEDLDYVLIKKSVSALLRYISKTEKEICIDLSVFGSDILALRAVIQSSALGLHKYSLKSEQSMPSLNKIVLYLPKLTSDMKKEFKEELLICEFTAKARDLVNMPSNIATPTSVMNYTKKLAKENGFSVTEIKDISKFPLFEAVGRGSKEKPRLLVLKYIPNKGKPFVLVGKGITYDAGGISVKPGSFPSNALRHMKIDMSGASSVIHTIALAARMKLKNPVIGIVPLCENLPDGNAFKVDDVIRSHKGKSVEIVHTDAEGRLILADALELATEFRPSLIIDVATLTGGSLYALGDKLSPVMGNDDELVETLIYAGDEEHETLWPLPLYPHYKKLLDSKIADVKNLNESPSSPSIIGGLFLEKFIDDYPWAHLDLGVSTFKESADEDTIYGANAFGTRTLARFLINNS